MKLEPRYVAKPWGQTALPAPFNVVFDQPIGEIWFQAGGGSQLLAKYLFTSEPLSIQVHPDDAQARLRGAPAGKAECWYVLGAAEGATIGLGLRRPLTQEQLRLAALDGSIVEAIEWRPVRTGDFFYVPPGTIHAIGGGISLLEFQQNSDMTYRLYDYGRPRELHLEDALAVCTLGEYPATFFQRVEESDERVLIDGPKFTFAHCHSDALQSRKRWVLPLEGTVHCDGEKVGAGECLLVEAGKSIETTDARLFVGAEY